MPSPHFSHSLWPAPVQEADRAGAARSAMWGIGLVSRFRSSLNNAAGSDAKLRNQRDTRNIDTSSAPFEPEVRNRLAATLCELRVWGTSTATHPVGFFNRPFGL